MSIDFERGKQRNQACSQSVQTAHIDSEKKRWRKKKKKVQPVQYGTTSTPACERRSVLLENRRWAKEMDFWNVKMFLKRHFSVWVEVATKCDDFFLQTEDNGRTTVRPTLTGGHEKKKVNRVGHFPNQRIVHCRCQTLFLGGGT